MSEDVHEQKAREAAIVILISLKNEAKIKSNKEIEIEIRNALKEGLARLPWLVLKNVIVVEE